MPIRMFIEGEFACFTNPILKAEPVSYDLPPPTAALGIAETILKKPEFDFQVLSVALARHSSGYPTHRVGMMFNEVKKAPADVADERTQRRYNMIRFPAYIITYQIIPGCRPITRPGRNLNDYVTQFERRLERGQGVGTPCLGLRQLVADARLATPDDVPIDETRPVGSIAYIKWARNNYVTRRNDFVRVVQPDVWVMNGTVDMTSWK